MSNKKLVAKVAEKFGVEPAKMLESLAQTAFKQKPGVVITEQQMIALLVVADQYDLNPWTKEIYAFPDKNGGIVPVVGVDGWTRRINENPMFNGIEFNQSETTDTPEGGKTCPEWMECIIHRKDREHPTIVREYLDEVYRKPFVKGTYTQEGPWQTHTKRMLRHKVMIQCARISFGFVGFYDPDEAERIIEGEIDITPRAEQMSPDPIDHRKVEDFVVFAVELIDKDEDELVLELQDRWSELSNDEKMSVNGHPKIYEKAPDSGPRGKMYKTILKEYTNLVPQEMMILGEENE